MPGAHDRRLVGWQSGQTLSGVVNTCISSRLFGRWTILFSLFVLVEVLQVDEDFSVKLMDELNNNAMLCNSQ